MSTITTTDFTQALQAIQAFNNWFDGGGPSRVGVTDISIEHLFKQATSFPSNVKDVVTQLGTSISLWQNLRDANQPNNLEAIEHILSSFQTTASSLSQLESHSSSVQIAANQAYGEISIKVDADEETLVTLRVHLKALQIEQIATKNERDEIIKSIASKEDQNVLEAVFDFIVPGDSVIITRLLQNKAKLEANIDRQNKLVKEQESKRDKLTAILTERRNYMVILELLLNINSGIVDILNLLNDTVRSMNRFLNDDRVEATSNDEERRIQFIERVGKKLDVLEAHHQVMEGAQ